MKTVPYTISKDDRLLIISANSGGGGFKMARLSCCYQKVYWYSHKTNGEHPWTMPKDYTCTERILAKNHFDRKLPNGEVVPLFGQRVSRFWDDDGWIIRWQSIYNSMDLPDQMLVFVSHDSPIEIRQWFPNSTIINLFEEDSINSSNWHLKTSANYRIDHHLSGMKPFLKNQYALDLDYILKNKKNPMFRDIWLFQTLQRLDWDEEAYKLYDRHEHLRIACENKLRKSQSKYCDINTTWETFNVDLLKPLLGNLNKNYDKVYSNPRFY